MPMDDRPTRDDRSCLLDLDDFYGRIGIDSIFNSPLVFIKYFKLNDKTQPYLHCIIINPHNHIYPYINNTLSYCLIVG